MKNQEQIKSKLSNAKLRLKNLEDVYNKNKSENCYYYIQKVKGEIKAYRWVLNYQ